MDYLSGQTIFAPQLAPLKGKKPQLMATSFQDKVIVPYLPQQSAVSTKSNWALYMMMCGTSTNVSLRQWKTYIAAYSCLIVPGFVSKLPSSSFSPVSLTENDLEQINTRMGNVVQAWEDNDAAALSTAVTSLASNPLSQHLPAVHSRLDWMFGAGENSAKVYFCHYSLVVFLCGKRLDKEDHSAIEVNRPRALKGKAHLQGDIGFLEGPLKLSRESHLPLNDAWQEMSSLRSLCFSEFANYNSLETEGGQDIIYTNVHLMRFSQMAHAKISFDFLRQFPWAAEVPSLRASVAVFADSAKAAAAYDAQMQPYIKLIMGDKAPIFPRKELEPLVCCAVSVQEEVHDTLADFYRSNDFNPIVESFQEERAKREALREGTLDKQLNEIEADESLYTPDTSTPAGPAA